MKKIFKNKWIMTFLDDSNIIRIKRNNTLEAMLEYNDSGKETTLIEMSAKILELQTKIEQLEINHQKYIDLITQL